MAYGFSFCCYLWFLYLEKAKSMILSCDYCFTVFDNIDYEYCMFDNDDDDTLTILCSCCYKEILNNQRSEEKKDKDLGVRNEV